MRNRSPRPDKRLRNATAAWLALAATAVLCSHSFAQTAGGFAQDVRVQIANATTGQPGSCDRITIDYVSARLDNVIDIRPEGPEFTIPAVPLKEGALYLVTAWHQGVPYFFSKRGRELVEGVQVLHVFDTTADTGAVTIAGMNVLVRRQETLVRLEYMVQVQNQAKPQATVLGSPHTFALDFPAGAQEIAAFYHRGPEPTPIETAIDANGRLGLAAPLVSGITTIRIEAVIDWSEGLTLPVGADLPLQAWSLLASPQWLEVTGVGLDSGDDQSEVPGFRRFSGQPLAAGETLTVTLGGGEQKGGPQGQIFSQAGPDSQADDQNAGPAAQTDKSNLPLVIGGILILFVVATAASRRLRR